VIAGFFQIPILSWNQNQERFHERINLRNFSFMILRGFWNNQNNNRRPILSNTRDGRLSKTKIPANTCFQKFVTDIHVWECVLVPSMFPRSHVPQSITTATLELHANNQKLVFNTKVDYTCSSRWAHGGKKKRLLSLTKWDTKKASQEVSIVHEVTLKCIHTCF